MATVRRPKVRVNLDKVKVDVIDAALKSLKLDDTGSTEVKISRLSGYFRQHTAKADISDCTSCGGESDVTFAIKGVTMCPFCGDTEIEGEETAAPPAPAPKHASDAKAAKSKFERKPKPPKGKAKKAANPEAIVPANAKQKEPETIVLDASTLDASVQKISSLKVDAARNIHALGTEIRRNYELELWKLRKVEGLVAYRNFKAFCARELHMSHSYAYKLIEVAKAFTAEQVEQLGAAKLGIVLQVPADKRAKLLDAANKGASAKDLKKKAKKATGGKDTVTIAVAFGRVTVPLFARPKKKGEAMQPARKLEDDPWAAEDMVNDLRTLYWVKRNAKGEMVLVIERRRP